MFKALGLLASVAFALAVGETCARLRFEEPETRAHFWPGIFAPAPPPRTWTLRASYRGVYKQDFVSSETTTNALGMRDPPLTSARREARARVLLLGDSVAFGRGVADDEAFARRLERRCGPGVAVFDAGVPGYDTVQELASLEALGPSLRPHLVLLQWYRNDVQVPSASVVVQVVEGQLVSSPEDYERWKRRYLYHEGDPREWSRLAQVLGIAWKTWRSRRSLDDRAAEGFTLEEAGLRRCLEALRGIHAWCRRNDARLAVALFPAREEVEVEGAAPPGYMKQLSAACLQLGVPCLDLTERWRAHWRESRRTLYLPHDRCHPNPEGHAMVAAWLGEGLRGELPAMR